MIGIIRLYDCNTKYRIALQEYELDHYEFLAYMAKYNKIYNETEFLQRFLIFKDNIAYIRVQNSRNLGFYLGVNRFADLTFEEFRLTYLPNKFETKTIKKYRQISQIETPQSVDWRTQGAVTPVKNQGLCGGCWAFSTTGAVEGIWSISGNPLISLSEQELIDCSSSYGNNGCSGGLMDFGFEYIMARGITSEDNYPYKASQNYCNPRLTTDVVAEIHNYVDINEGNFQEMIAAVSNQPISVAVEADQES